MNEETQAPEATPQNTQAPETASVDAAEFQKLQAKYERAQKDLQKFRTRAEEVEAAQRAAEEKALAEKGLAEQVEALKAQLAERDQIAQEAVTKATMAERRAALVGKVADPNAALKLVEDAHLTEDGNVNVDALLDAYPFLAPQQAGPAPTRGAGGTTPTQPNREQQRNAALARGDFTTYIALGESKEQ